MIHSVNIKLLIILCDYSEHYFKQNTNIVKNSKICKTFSRENIEIELFDKQIIQIKDKNFLAITRTLDNYNLK